MYKWILSACVVLQVEPATAETLESYLERDGSHAILVLDLPFNLLQQVIAARLQDQYSGSERDPTDALVEDTLTWSARPSVITLAQHGDCLTVEGRATGTVRVAGKINLLLGRVPASAHADLRAGASFQACPTLHSDWSLDSGLSGSVRLTEADVYGLSLRGLFQDDLDRAVRDGLSRITSELQEPSFLRNEVAKLWESVCNLSDDTIDIAVRPRAVAATQPEVRADALRISFAVSGDVVAGQDPAEPCPALPASLIVLETDKHH